MDAEATNMTNPNESQLMSAAPDALAMQCMNEPKNPALVFVCSGAADVGELTDRAARQLHREGCAAMSCLAGIGARDADMMFNTDVADRVLVIDGCPTECASRTFREAGITKFSQFNLAEIGLRKGASPVTEQNIRRVMDGALDLLQNGAKRP